LAGGLAGLFANYTVPHWPFSELICTVVAFENRISSPGVTGENNYRADFVVNPNGVIIATDRLIGRS